MSGGMYELDDHDGPPLQAAPSKPQGTVCSACGAHLDDSLLCRCNK